MARVVIDQLRLIFDKTLGVDWGGNEVLSDLAWGAHLVFVQ